MGANRISTSTTSATSENHIDATNIYIGPKGDAMVIDERSGIPDAENPIWIWTNQWSQHCRFCGVGHEGTAGATLAHFRECNGIVVYSHARAEGVDSKVALRIAIRVVAEIEKIEIPNMFTEYVDEFLKRTGLTDEEARS